MIALAKLPFSARIANALVSYAAYLGQTFCPTNLAAFYPHPEGGWPASEVTAALIVLAGISAAAVALRRRAPAVFVGWLWYLGMLVPVIGLVQVGSHAMADRYSYLPQIGLCIAVAWGCLQVVGAWPYRQWICGAAALAALAGLIDCSRLQASHWRDSESLWTHALECTSRNNLAHSDLGVELARLGRFDEAILQYKEAMKIRPGDAESHSNLGNALARRGRIDEAVEQYRQALKLKPGYAEAHSNLGVALAGLGRLDEAVSQYQEALRIEPRRVEAISNLGNALATSGPAGRSDRPISPGVGDSTRSPPRCEGIWT